MSHEQPQDIKSIKFENGGKDITVVISPETVALYRELIDADGYLDPDYPVSNRKWIDETTRVREQLHQQFVTDNPGIDMSEKELVDNLRIVKKEILK